MKKDLTIKQKQFLIKYFKYGNGTKAAMEVYDTDDYQTAASIANENLKKLENPVKTLMEKRGLDLNRLLDVLDDGLSGTDRNVRHKYLETAAKWLDIDKKDEGNKTQVNIFNQPEFVKRYEEN